MAASGPASSDPPDGELTVPPPSDLSDYTWDDSDRESRQPAIAAGDGQLADGTPLRSGSEEFDSFFDGLVRSRLLVGPELPPGTARAYSRLALRPIPNVSPRSSSAVAG